jgi:hypothetical protein
VPGPADLPRNFKTNMGKNIHGNRGFVFGCVTVRKRGPVVASSFVPLPALPRPPQASVW